MAPVPTVDLARPSSASLDALDAACRDHGFFLVEGHGADDVIAAGWAAARRFFAAGSEVKAPVRRTEHQHLGWFDRELTKRFRDHKEVFDFVDPSIPDDRSPNRWPALDGFRPAMHELYAALSGLMPTVLGLVHAALGADPSVVDTISSPRATGNLRLNHYTAGDPVPPGERDGLRPLGDVALGHHTDPGVATLLLQDDVGGLQARTRAGDWIDVDPRPGTIVVNLGDAVQVWTNDRYVAAVHRVLPMQGSDRFSIPYFANPVRDAVIEPIAALVSDRPRYRGFAWREFVQARASDNYADLGVDDAQVSRYRNRGVRHVSDTTVVGDQASGWK